MKIKPFLWLKTVKSKLGKWFWVILALVAIVGGFLLLKKGKKTDLVSATVQKGTVKEELILTGSVNAEKYATLYFPTSGKISWVGVKEGQEVYRGQALTSLDKTTLNAAYQQALNNYRSYQASADSVVDSVKNHSSDESFAQKATRTAAEVARDNAFDSVKAAKYNLDNATIIAPFAGLISLLPFTSPGVNVSFTDPQVTLVDPATIYFDVDADQNDVTNLKVGQKVVIVLDSYQDKTLDGTVSFISFTPKTGVAGTTYKVKVVFAPGTLSGALPRIGMTGDAKFTLSEKQEALYVPSDFVKSDIKGKYLRVGKSNNKTYIETGLEGEERIEILGDKVKVGDTVYD